MTPAEALRKVIEKILEPILNPFFEFIFNTLVGKLFLIVGCIIIVFKNFIVEPVDWLVAKCKDYYINRDYYSFLRKKKAEEKKLEALEKEENKSMVTTLYENEAGEWVEKEELE